MVVIGRCLLDELSRKGWTELIPALHPILLYIGETRHSTTTPSLLFPKFFFLSPFLISHRATRESAPSSEFS